VGSLGLPHSIAHAALTRRSAMPRADQRLRRNAVHRPLTHVVAAQQSKNRSVGASDQQPLLSPSTVAQVRKHIECLVEAVNAHTPPGETVELNRSPSNSTGVVANGVLSIPPQIYREYAAECRALARAATNESQRGLYLKIANTWTFAAVRFEAGLGTTAP
jgi:hypothetical protein